MHNAHARAHVWKELDGPELHGAQLFQRNCQNVPGAAGAAAGAAASAAFGKF